MIHVILHHVDHTVNVAKQTVMLFVVVSKDMLAVRQIVVQNVSLVLNVLKTRLVPRTSAKILAREHADKTHVVKLLIITQYALVLLDLVVIHF